MIAIPNMEKPQNCAECPISALSEFSGIVCKLNRDNDKSNCPLIDIVTCRECKWWDKADRSCGIRDSYGWEYKPTDFCSYGEGRADDNKRRSV